MSTIPSPPTGATTMPSSTAMDVARDTIVYRAKLAEQAERFDDMVLAMKELVALVQQKQPGQQNQQLSAEERNLLSVAYKGALGSRRVSWQLVKEELSEQGNQNDPKPNNHQKTILHKFQHQIADEVVEICRDILSILEESLIPNENDEDDSEEAIEGKIFYQKMRADYHRYLCEVAGNNDDLLQQHRNAALKAYQVASDLAATSVLSPLHPLRLGLALNFSVFYYEIMQAPDEAFQAAKHAFEEGVSELDLQGSGKHGEALVILQLLRDNLMLWSDEDDSQVGEEKEVPTDGAIDHQLQGSGKHDEALVILQLLRDNLMLWSDEGGSQVGEENEVPTDGAFDMQSLMRKRNTGETNSNESVVHIMGHHKLRQTWTLGPRTDEGRS